MSWNVPVTAALMVGGQHGIGRVRFVNVFQPHGAIVDEDIHAGFVVTNLRDGAVDAVSIGQIQHHQHGAGSATAFNEGAGGEGNKGGRPS
ncbi:hypothetical protein [Agrobacterium sp.]|uniref:hypothetical protein n=1 Tax=Agrobacterium sp. TaxID=361 RepID=UPI0028B0CB10|nr:hypothetical protein [Agrobacterium sp.]